MNPYLGPIVDALGGSRLDPIVLDRHARRADAANGGFFAAPGMERVLPADAIRSSEARPDPADEAAAREAALGIADVRVAVPCCGVDLGPDLARDVSAYATGWFPRKPGEILRTRRLLERVPAAGVLVADEYHRQECVEAARSVGIPVFAVQHGTIFRHHNGYMHADRPATLQLPDVTYVFGRWERDLLVHDSVYREDEVVASGSPRVDLFRPEDVHLAAVRAELGVAPGDRMVVLSGTYGSIYRRFHYPVLLARLFDRSLPGVHLVVKQHPAELDEGPYRAVVEGVAAAGGFQPPAITVVREVDLYRLLAAADAHLGIHSTVLTEAVLVGTPNLLAAGVCGGDLLGYVAAGVAVPVADGGELLAALDGPATFDPAARDAFLRRHFEPGSASRRISDDLLARTG